MSMTPHDVEQRVQQIIDVGDDPETTHGLEDELYCDVLRAIAGGAEEPRELAESALQAVDLDLVRWYA